MKKIKSVALMVFSLVAAEAVGQNLKVTANGNPVSDGDIVEVKCEVEDYSEDFGYTFIYYSWNPELEASVADGEEILYVTLSKVDDQRPFEICWPGMCINYVNGKASTSGKISTSPTHIDVHISDQTSGNIEASLDGGLSKVHLECGSESLDFTLKGLPLDPNSVDENLVEDLSSAEYYSIQGLRVAVPQPGHVYIERKGGKVTKRVF